MEIGALKKTDGENWRETMKKSTFNFEGSSNLEILEHTLKSS